MVLVGTDRVIRRRFWSIAMPWAGGISEAPTRSFSPTTARSDARKRPATRSERPLPLRYLGKLVKRTSMSSSPAGIRLKRMSTVRRHGAAHPERLQKECHHVRTSNLNRSLRAAAVVAVLSALLSPAKATGRQDTIAVFPDVSTTAPEDRAPSALTLRLPWLAPVGHWQPSQADVPQHEAVSAWEQQQQQSDQELDRKLVICPGVLTRCCCDHSRAE